MSSASPQQPVRGLVTCPKCRVAGMVRNDSVSHELPAEEGAVVKEMVYRCTEDGCGGVVKIDWVSRGTFAKLTLRPGSHAR